MTQRAPSAIRNMLNSAAQQEKLTGAAARMHYIVSMYNQASDIDPNFRQDVFNILNSAADLAEAMLDKTYPIDHILSKYADILIAGRNIYEYVERTRPARYGHAIMHLGSGHLMPTVHATETEANGHLQNLEYMAQGQIDTRALYRVVPVKVTSQYVVQPRAPSPKVASAPVALSDFYNPEAAPPDHIVGTEVFGSDELQDPGFATPNFTVDLPAEPIPEPLPERPQPPTIDIPVRPKE